MKDNLCIMSKTNDAAMATCEVLALQVFVVYFPDIVCSVLDYVGSGDMVEGLT